MASQGRVYVGMMSHQHFYNDLPVWLRQLLGHPAQGAGKRRGQHAQKEGTRIFFLLLNHQNSPVRVQFYEPMHDFLTGNNFSGNYDLPSHGVLVLFDHPEARPVA